MTDTTIIEERAIHKMESLILEDERLSSHIEKGDRAPVLDGYISVYESGNHTIGNLRYGVPVQIKGTEIAPSRKGASFKFKRKWLEAYSKDIGAVFFVVFENTTTKKMDVYYKTFLPAYAKKLLNNFSEEQDGKNFRLTNLNKTNLWSVLEYFHNWQIDMSRQTKVVDITKISEMSDLRVNIPVGADLFDIYPEDIACSGILDGSLALIDNQKSKFNFFKLRNLTVKFPNGDIFDAILVEESEVKTTLNIGNSIKFEFTLDEERVKVVFKPNFNNPNRTEIFEKLPALESFIRDPFVYLYLNSRPERMDLPFNFDGEILENIKKSIKALKESVWLKKVLKVDYLANISDLDDQSKNVILNLINLYFNKEVRKSNHPSFFRVAIKNDYFALTYDDTGGLKSVFDKENIFFLNGNFVLTNNPDGNEYYPGNPYVLINENLHQMPDYDIAMVLNNFENKTVVPEWYADSVNQLGLAYIKSFDISNDIKWLTGAETIFSLPFLTDELITCINIAQIYYRKYSGKLRPVMVRKLLNLDDGSNMIAHLCVAILTEDAESAKIIWEKLTNEEKDNFKNFPIINIANDELKEIFNS